MTPPFRADHVGSLLRPPYVKTERERAIRRSWRNRKRSASRASPTASSAATGGTSTSSAGRAGIAYDDMEEFWADAAQAYRDAIAAFAAAGCTYLQLDDVAFAYLCDPKIREQARKNGDDPQALPARYARTLREILGRKPAGMTVALHTCRGNFKSAWVAEGGYEPVAEAMFSSGVDAFFMEFDTERAGGFSSTHHGNALTPEEQWRKLELVVELAHEVWS